MDANNVCVSYGRDNGTDVQAFVFDKERFSSIEEATATVKAHTANMPFYIAIQEQDNRLVYQSNNYQDCVEYVRVLDVVSDCGMTATITKVGNPRRFSPNPYFEHVAAQMWKSNNEIEEWGGSSYFVITKNEEQNLSSDDTMFVGHALRVLHELSAAASFRPDKNIGEALRDFGSRNPSATSNDSFSLALIGLQIALKNNYKETKKTKASDIDALRQRVADIIARLKAARKARRSS